MSCKLTIVTISFNQKKYLSQCLESVLSGKTKDTEYVVIDPGSTDGSREIISQYRHSIDQIILSPDQGPADGLNKGFGAAQGRFGMYINSDDFLLPHWNTKVDRLIEEAGNASVILASGWLVNEQGLPVRQLRARKFTPEQLVTSRTSFFQQGMIFDIGLFRKVGGFNQKNRTCWDLELIASMMSQQPLLYHSSTRLAAFRMQSESLSSGAAGDKHQKKFELDLKRIAAKTIGHDARIDYGFLSKKFGKHIRDPSIALDHFAEKLVPGLMRKRWRTDHTAQLPEIGSRTK